MDKGTISRILKDPFYYGILIQAGTKVDLSSAEILDKIKNHAQSIKIKSFVF